MQHGAETTYRDLSRCPQVLETIGGDRIMFFHTAGDIGFTIHLDPTQARLLAHRLLIECHKARATRGETTDETDDV